MTTSPSEHWIIATDPFVPCEEKDRPIIFRKGHGWRVYYCGEVGKQPKLEWSLSDAVRFESKEAAETRVLILYVVCPDLIDHVHVLTGAEALDQWKKDLDEYQNKIDLSREERDNGGCF